MNFLINGIKFKTDKTELTYEEVVNMLGRDSDRVYSVMYTHRTVDRKDGILYKGSKPVVLSDHMSFDVAMTNNA